MDSAVKKARPPEKMIRTDGRNVLRTPSLGETVVQEDDFPYTKQDLEKKQSGEDYTVAKKLWPTPRAGNPGSRAPGTGGKVLGEETKKWPTPTTSDGYTPSHKDNHDVERGLLRGVVQQRPTPRTQMTRAVQIREDGYRSNLEEAVAIIQASEKAVGQLNPSWVSWLMGLPVNWESLEPLNREDFDAWLEHQRNGTWWDEERGLPRVSRGVSKRVDRLRACGNGIVPASAAKFITLIGFTGKEI